MCKKSLIFILYEEHQKRYLSKQSLVFGSKADYIIVITLYDGFLYSVERDNTTLVNFLAVTEKII